MAKNLAVAMKKDENETFVMGHPYARKQQISEYTSVSKHSSVQELINRDAGLQVVLTPNQMPGPMAHTSTIDHIPFQGSVNKI